MKRPYTAAPGVTLTSIGLFNATPIHGIVVDNPSGGWLYVVELQDYIPPYTLQWSRDLEYAGTAVTVRYGQSPAAQVSTQQGDPYTVTLYDTPVGSSAGTAANFIEQFTPVLAVILSHTYTAGDAVASISTSVNPGATRRIRLHGIFLSTNDQEGVITEVQGGAGLLGVVPDSVLRIAGKKTHDERLFNPYVDLPLGSLLSLQLNNVTTASLDPSFCNGSNNVEAELSALYEII